MAEDQVKRPGHLLVIGGSAGSLEAILKILPNLRSGMDIAVIIVVHRKPSTDTILVDLLNSKMDMKVKEVEEKEMVLRNQVYIAPADYHVLVENDLTLSLDVSEKIHFSRPSIDVTFESVADVMGRNVVALLLSGANADGVEGLRKIKDKGGLCIVQEPASAEVEYMPRQALERVHVDKVLPTGEIAGYINQLF